MRIFSIILITFFFSSSLFAQRASKTSRVKNPKFEKTIDAYLANTVPTINVNQVNIESNSIKFLDARELEEYKVSHIPNAEYIGYSKLDLSGLKNVNPGDTIIVYCSIGYRSEKVGEKLIEMGYQNVLNLYGSIFEWSNQNLPLEDINGEPTNNVHAFNRKWGKWIENPEIKKAYK